MGVWLLQALVVRFFLVRRSAALLDIDSSGRRGVDLPEVKSTYWRPRDPVAPRIKKRDMAMFGRSATARPAAICLSRADFNDRQRACHRSR